MTPSHPSQRPTQAPHNGNNSGSHTGGEFELIRRHFVRPHTLGAHVVSGPGDDCALLQHTPDSQLAVSSDMLVAGRHFFANTDPKRLGHKALAVNLSDLAAMGATPRSFTLSLALPELNDDWLAQFSEGLFALASAHQCSLVGGDTTRGPLTICITIMGEVAPQHALKRSGAQVGDTVFVSGALGEAAWALQAINQDSRACALRHTSTTQQWTQALDRLEVPTPRNALGLALCGIANSAMDLSDGLAGDVQHLLSASQVGARINIDALPHAPALAVAEPDYRRQLCASGGDDYELLFTAPPQHTAAVKAMAQTHNIAITPVGVITAARELRWVDHAGEAVLQQFQAFDHFKPS
jgi:thiamine-monophosphate kinase